MIHDVDRILAILRWSGAESLGKGAGGGRHKGRRSLPQMARTNVLAQKEEASLGAVCAMRDLRFVATELKQLQSDELLPKDTADKMLPKLVYDTARLALGLPAEASTGDPLVEDTGRGGGVLSLVNGSSYSASGIGLCLFSVAMLIALDIANFVVMEVPPPITWAVLLLLLSSAPLTHAAGTEMHDSYKLCQPLQGGNTFILLQGFGWTIYGFICLVVLWEALHAHLLCPVSASVPLSLCARARRACVPAPPLSLAPSLPRSRFLCACVAQLRVASAHRSSRA